VRENLNAGPYKSQLDAYNAELATYTTPVTAHNDWVVDQAKRGTAHDDAAAALTVRVTAQDARVADFNRRQADFVARRKQHDDNQCKYPANSPSACDYYEAERVRLDQERNSLVSEISEINQTAAVCNAEKAKLDAQRDDFIREQARIEADKVTLDSMQSKVAQDKAAYHQLIAPLLTI